MKRLWIDEEILVFKHQASGAWTEEERCDMKRPRIEEEYVFLNIWSWEPELKKNDVI